MKHTLFTIGYTGFSIHDFVNVLLEHGVECLLDAREIPISRKKGFSKTALSGHLADAGIEYWHSRLLGSPKVVRHELRETHDYGRFFRRVHKHINQAEVAAELKSAIFMARKQTTCVMCCCPDWKYCHRRCLVEAISECASFSFQHLDRESIIIQHRRAA